MKNLKITYVHPDKLRPYPSNARTHSKKQIRQIADSIERFGFVNPVLVSDEFEIVAGHGRWLGAKQLGLTSIPAVQLSSMSEADRRAYVLADNKLASLAGWDNDLLAIELQGLLDLGYVDLEITGFSLGEIDKVLDEAADKAEEPGPEDVLPEASASEPVTRTGYIWTLGAHRLICGDARAAEDYAALLADEPVDLVLTDPPYNVPVDGHVSGLGKVRHGEFAMASGEMSEREFTDFLSIFLARASENARDGALLFVFMDWRHLFELISAARTNELVMKNLIVWAKDNAGMGSFYRSKHELVSIFKKGRASHTNTFELGQHGRYRTNVWEYAGANTFRAGRMEDLAMHPTVKPVAMLADAIRDVTKRGDLVLDPFAGSGSTLIAAEKTGRRARCIEFDAAYCDVIVRRWETFTGKQALFDDTDLTFEDLEHAGTEPRKGTVR